MHLSLVFTLSLFSLALPSLGSPEDILYIQKSLSDFAIISDSGSISGVPDFSTFNKVFTNNVTFDFQTAPGIVRGLANLETVFRANIPPGTVTQNAVSTESISLSNFDEQGSASGATALSYLTTTYFGQGNLTGQIVALYVKFEDTLVKTKLQGNGGWRIATRISKYFVRRFSSICLMQTIDQIEITCVGEVFID
ncbi:hypothetical protein MMC22_011042 [Lobaria immixta]|nr:hypothetical protein [Lobaria immixta]